MTAKRFTKEEIEVLNKNPFTHRVTENVICFTIEFKELFWSYYQSGLQPMAIFARMGYDPNILGERRIGNISHRIRKTIFSGKGFDTSYGPKPKPRPKNYDEMLPEVAIDSMTYELKYLRQEVEFLKKLYALETRKEARGSHYTSKKFIQIVNDSKLRRSMSRRGNCWDNAPQESFFGHMKQETHFEECRTVKELKAAIDDWMYYYNNDRYQERLAKLSPNEYYEYITTVIYPLKI